MDDWWGEGRCNEGFDGPTRCQATMQKLTRRNETRTQPKPGRIWINNTKQPVGGSRVGNGKKGGVRKIGARKHFLSLPDAKTFYQIEIINEKNSVIRLLVFSFGFTFPLFPINFLESSTWNYFFSKSHILPCLPQRLHQLCLRPPACGKMVSEKKKNNNTLSPLPYCSSSPRLTPSDL